MGTSAAYVSPVRGLAAERSVVSPVAGGAAGQTRFSQLTPLLTNHGEAREAVSQSPHRKFQRPQAVTHSRLADELRTPSAGAPY